MIRAPLELEATGETVGEAKWVALRELEKLHPGIDRDEVVFEILAEGERGLLGVGTAPARVVARWTQPLSVGPESGPAHEAREVVERIVEALGLECRIDVKESEEEVDVSLRGGDLGLVIGRHGQTIDAIEYVVGAVVRRRLPDEHRSVVVDAADYRQRRRARLDALAVRSAEQALRTGRTVQLEPMTPAERKVVHLRLKSYPGIETRSEGEEPNRCVVVAPAARLPERSGERGEGTAEAPGSLPAE